MLISIITVNYNDALGLTKTLNSIQNQSYKNFEHIVIDGGSSDSSNGLIEKNKKHISFWVSEPDDGIYDAMNKGIAQAKGTYLLFLNSGDILYRDDLLSTVQPTLVLGKEIVYGNLWIEDAQGVGFTNIYPASIDFSFLKRTSLGHGATFIKKTLFERYGNYRTDLKIVSDWAFFVKTLCVEMVSQAKVDTVVSTFYEGGISTKSENKKLHIAERKQVLLEHFDLYDQTFDSVLEDQTKKNLVWSKINSNVHIIATNTFSLKILNLIIASLAGILTKKRQWFKKK